MIVWSGGGASLLAAKGPGQTWPLRLIGPSPQRQHAGRGVPHQHARGQPADDAGRAELDLAATVTLALASPSPADTRLSSPCGPYDHQLCVVQRANWSAHRPFRSGISDDRIGPDGDASMTNRRRPVDVQTRGSSKSVAYFA